MWFTNLPLFLQVSSFMLVCFIHETVASKKSSGPSPVVIIPGTGGARAQIELFSGGKPIPLWMSFDATLGFDKMMSYFGLTYKPCRHQTRSSRDGRVSFPGFGDTWSIEHLGWAKAYEAATQYFARMVEGFAKNPFYVRGKTVRGAPYDFRRAPNEASTYFRQLKRLIKETYKNAGRRRVMLVSHSLGGLYSQYFIKHAKPRWRKKYIRGLIMMGTPFAGTVESLKVELHGRSSYFFSTRQYRSILRSWSSMAFMLPNARYWSDKEPLVITPNRNYTTADYAELFRDINFPTGYLMRKDTEQLLNPDTDIPQVDEVYCIHGEGIDTEKRLVYKESRITNNSFAEEIPSIEYEDGDGTVNTRSLSACKNWPGVKYKVIPKLSHTPMLMHPTVIDYVKEILERGE